ncbi:MAG: hypothetical protein ACJAX3_002420 [Patiriisocius sp.]|jgi:hypothetical protein
MNLILKIMLFLSQTTLNQLFIMYQQLLQRIESSKSFDFGNVLSKSISLFKKVWVEGFVHLLLIFVISLPVIIFFYVGMFIIMGANYFIAGGESGFVEQQEFDPVMIPSLIGLFLLVILLAAVLQAFNIALMAHFYQVCKKADTGSTAETGGYFVYLKKSSFKKLLVLSFATVGVALLAALLCWFPLFYVTVPLSMSGVIFAFNSDLSVKENLTASFKLGNKYWLPVFGMILLAGIIGNIGIIACGIGVLFTAMFAYIPAYYIYKDTIGFEENSADRMTTSEIDF